MSTSLWGRELKGPIYWKTGKCRKRRPPCEVVNWKKREIVRFKQTVCRPPCEVVNWKTFMELSSSKIDVDLLVRSWIERSFHSPVHFPPLSTSLWGRELKGPLCGPLQTLQGSTSLWGRELKDHGWTSDIPGPQVDLLVRSWIESNISILPLKNNPVDLLVRSWIERIVLSLIFCALVSRPPCEVVNWKDPDNSFKWGTTCRPPCEVVNWKIGLVYTAGIVFRRPPCEVVNWKKLGSKYSAYHHWSTSLWGRELKVDWGKMWIGVYVDLLVRSWIER